VAKAFSDLGARLALLDLKRGDLQDGPNRVFVEVNLLNADSAAAAVGKALERFGRIDALCNIAGAFRMGPPVHETKDADWDAFYQGLQEVLPAK
jgi:NAD(P)-dependent dehydrogenase (short-subunit alcohol dehydrogenase family)